MLNAQEIVRQISIDTGILPVHLHEIIRTAPLRYKVFTIPKKNGGEREVAQPAREVKKIQRWIVQQLTPLLPIHGAATAYRTNSSIQHNANQHANNNSLLKIDFQKFFPSIVQSDISHHLEIYCAKQFDATAIALLARCLCWAPRRQPPLRLCIGAPSSPLLSNSILYSFDLAVSAAAAKKGVIYTRYADDISLSSSKGGVLDEMLELIKTTLNELEYPNIKINTKKTVFASRKGRRNVTGIVITPDKKLSVGRERKKTIRAMYHRHRCGLLDQKEQERLAGLLSFVDSIEPGFSERLAESYNAN